MFNEKVLEEIQNTRDHQFSMANASDTTPIEDYSKVPYSKYIDWKILLSMNDGDGSFRHCLSFEKRRELLEKIKKYEETNQR
jgi:hypothetical protein